MHGRRDGRFLYLTWDSPSDSDWGMFRRAKLMLDHIDPDLVGAAGDQDSSPTCPWPMNTVGPGVAESIPSISWGIGGPFRLPLVRRSSAFSAFSR